MVIHAMVKINSERMRHGVKNSKSRGSAKTGAVSRVLKNFREERLAQKAGEARVKEILPLDNVPKAYGSHDGNNHGAIISKMSGSIEQLMDWLLTANAVISTFESSESIDIKNMKENYRSERDRVTRSIARTYGKNVDDRGTALYDEQMRKLRFFYVKTQMTLLLWSENEFPGSEWDERRKLFVAAFKSKSVFTQELFGSDFINNLRQIGSGNFIAGSIKKSPKRLPGTIMESSKGHLKVIKEAPLSNDASGWKEQLVVDPETWAVAQLDDSK